MEFISRDEEAIRKLIKAGKEFWDRVINYDPPEEEIQELGDVETLRAVQEWKDAKEALVLAQEAEEEAKQKLIEIANGVPFKAGGISVRKTFRRGAIEYKSIIELAGIDLEKYRKGAVEFWRVG